MERLVSVLPGEIRNVHGIIKETFKRNLDEWLKRVPDEPRINNYSVHSDKEKQQSNKACGNSVEYTKKILKRNIREPSKKEGKTIHSTIK